MPTQEKRGRGRPRKEPKAQTWPFSCPDLGRNVGEKLDEMSARRRLSKTKIVKLALAHYYESEENQDELEAIPPTR